ncbi:hypothetical protein FOMPIDRAFT_1027644 [Fomitopsis schrenkii]|uniref:Uncharacterized protein n=1 Tax=Fomitopsis schrenkii TaxID=2126942 RepID=S8G3W0_FOMSC|nr:hypothetical protein FOMPIDRAFT_1027644 [Fomitopsis schrenkii]
MALKRKMSFDDEVAPTPMRVKQQKLIPFPGTEADDDVAMTDASYHHHLEPLFIPMQQPFHMRLSSDVSYASSSPGDSPRIPSAYPYFDLYPAEDQAFNAFDSPVSEASRPVGLLQPKNPSFTHHGQNCSQIPKLRVACSPGLNGSRTMWAHCEQCGAIEMVHTD